ncbi:hypothetical protein SK128_022327 [Halocaridina rubra]|uniref:Uncharacterized protein n=1 Tax=Halocaridina rubra TaxID=373956 RepID=A0AAN8X2L7_HALRR
MAMMEATTINEESGMLVIPSSQETTKRRGENEHVVDLCSFSSFLKTSCSQQT